MKLNNILISHTLLAVLVMMYFSESGYIYLSNLDDQLFFLLNSTLGISPFWDNTWMMLNHKNESIISVVAMLIITFSSFLWAKDLAHQRIYIANSINTLFFLELFIIIKFVIFAKFFPIERLSPSLVHEGFISLQEMFNSTDIKVSSSRSFPGDHAFVITSWALLTMKFAPKRLFYIIIPFWVLMLCARLVAGAHWFTDALFGILFSYVLFSYASQHNVWYFMERKILALIKKFYPKKEQ